MSGGRQIADNAGGLFARQPPANVPAEQALLGSMLANNRACEAVADYLVPDHFFDPVNARIYEAIARRVALGLLADGVTLAAELATDPALGAVGGAKYLGDLLRAGVSMLHVPDYGRAIYECWHRRRLIEIADAVIGRCFAPGDARAAQIQEDAESAMFELAEAQAAERAVPAHEAMGLAIDAAAKAAAAPSGLVGLTTGFRELDDITGGLRKGRLTLLAARPSMGKTTLALGIAAGAARAGARVLFVSREMPVQDIGAALAAGIAKVPRDAADRGRIRGRDEAGRFVYRPIGDAELNAMLGAQRAMATSTLLIDECRAGTLAAVRSRARREKRRGGLDLIVLDYIGLMRVPELARVDNRVLEISRLSADCKALAVDLDIPVLVLSQLNRGTESRDDKRPTMADLRDSGALEQDADVVAFLFRDEYYLERSPVGPRKPGESDEKHSARVAEWFDAVARSKGVAEVIFAKNRMGPTGTRRIAFHGDAAWFGDLEEST